MIDQFLEYIATPILIIACQVMLICLNMHSIKDDDEMGLFKSIIWTIATLIIFPSLLTLSVHVNPVFDLVYISLCLLFLQIILNVEYLIQDYNRKKEAPKKKKRDDFY